MGDLPSLKVGSNVRWLARVMDAKGAGHAIWYDAELQRQGRRVFLREQFGLRHIFLEGEQRTFRLL